MNLHARLRTLRDALPAGGAVTFTREDLTELLDGAVEAAAFAVDDLTVKEAAKLLGRKPSTVRNWLVSGALEGAYKLNQRDWRIPRSVLRRYLDGQVGRDGREARRTPAGRTPDLASWRQHARG